MSREKLLWGVSGAVIAAAATSALLLSPLLLPNGQGEIPSSPSANLDVSSALQSPDIVARVGDVVLSRDEYIKEIDRKYGDQYLQEWMERTAVRLESQAVGISVSHDEVEGELRRMQRGYDSEEQFYRTMEEQLGMTKEELRADALYRLQLEKIATRNIAVSDGDIDRYIADHPEEFAPKQEVRFAQIIVNKKEEAEKVLENLGKGLDFGLLARDVSVDEDTASDGGDVGWVEIGDPFVPKELSDAAKTLPVGAVSEPIALEDGRFAVITIIGKRLDRPETDPGARDRLRMELALQQAPPLEDVLAQLLDKWGARATK